MKTAAPPADISDTVVTVPRPSPQELAGFNDAAQYTLLPANAASRKAFM